MLQRQSWLPMSLSQLYESVRHRRGERCGGAQATDHADQIEAPVEAVREFCEVARQMLGTDRPVGAMHGVLDVAQHRINPDERFAVLPPLRPARHERFVGTACLLDSVKARQAIGANMGAGLQVLATPATDLPAAKDPLTRSMRIVRGLPLAGSVATAATKGVLPRVPRPRL